MIGRLLIHLIKKSIIMKKVEVGNHLKNLKIELEGEEKKNTWHYCIYKIYKINKIRI